MKKTIIAMALLLAGCMTSNQYGACKGIADKDEESPTLQYEVSVRNVVLAVIFSETLLWPGLTAAFWTWCPTGAKK